MDNHTDFGLIRAPPVKGIPFEKPTRLSIRVTGTTSSSVTPTHFALQPTANHPTYRYYGCQNHIYQTLTQTRPSNTILTKRPKLRSQADFRKA
jgi:hypothetical protein